MKRSILLLSLALALPAFAGTSAKQEIAPAPAPEPSIWQWFAGASAGYLVDNDEAFYTAHVGVDTPWTVGGATVSLFLEGLYTKPEETFSGLRQTDLDIETQIIPVTLNVKFEKAIVGNLSGYIGAGAGVAFVDTDVHDDIFGDSSINDEVFAGQIFAGVVYNITPSFEVFGGARWIHLEDSDALSAVENEDFGFEGGLRYNF